MKIRSHADEKNMFVMPPCADDADATRHELKRRDIAWWEWGDPAKPSVLLLHGITSSHRSWSPVARLLAERGLHVIAWDMPLHGESRHDGDFTLEGCVDDLVGILDSCEVESCVVAAHSFGCYVAQQLVEAHPEMVDGAALFDGMPLSYPLTGLEHWSVYYYADFAWVYPLDAYVSQATKAACATEAAREGFAADLRALGKGGLLQASKLCYRDVINRDKLTFPEGMSLSFALGDGDTTGLVAEAMHEWSAAYGCGLEIVPDAAHNAPSDNPPFCTEAIADLVERCHA
ncbi:MAG: alpha/beta hydrolase [Atopobiaceae bacterium]|jgi:pimeloyl-ACP methyl ester carboxylesterase|nr:alpha/beta hydrolase [Atopobiaceae bacterium]MCH4180919.1 alpha/beta hydrolase [Atopobiaceae bacterium]MCH4214002.1 alpha/beta hydrolase [Atopobiaceae bacterium]MCH4229565.1 alpha/beta hydrolase [Atopobiaceae bacterium]MCH4276884.1 alpha/beta hydrolase [Atopobiaceae bacterium]